MVVCSVCENMPELFSFEMVKYMLCKLFSPMQALEDEDEIDAGLREVNELLGELPTSSSASANSTGITVDMRALLAVEHK